jgi:glycosyltransferase involved in cell wall biosynthesis
MRIGIDGLALQSWRNGNRGIGRFVRELVRGLDRANTSHDVLIYVHGDLGTDGVPSDLDSIRLRTLSPDRSLSEGWLSVRMERLLRTNPDHLDVFLATSPFEAEEGMMPPGRWPTGPALAAVVFDLIPLVFPEMYLKAPRAAATYRRQLERLRRYDGLLAISEATRRDCMERLGMGGERVTNISGAAASDVFRPDPDERMSPETREAFSALGIDPSRPFVLNVGGCDPRKDPMQVIGAFSRLPEELRNSHQLVLAFNANPWQRKAMEERAELLGLGRSVIPTGAVSEADLVRLYQRCAAFVFPSLYEGFGLPLLEAMSCGAAVIGGDNSSQPEVIGDAGLVANAADNEDVAAKLTRVLTEPGLARELGRKGRDRAAQFTWDHVAAKAIEGLEAAAARPVRRPRPLRPARPRIAFFSPLPPAKSGVADYSWSLLGHLKDHYQIDLFLEPGFVSEPAWEELGFQTTDVRNFNAIKPHRDYRGYVYQMGNSHFHQYLYPMMLSNPGVTTLHDFCLAGFHLNYGHALGTQKSHIITQFGPDPNLDIDALLAHLDELGHDHQEIADRYARARAFLNWNVFDSSRRVIMHSPWCREQVRDRMPQYLDRVDIVPMGARARVVSAEDRAAIRERFNLPADALVISAFGFVHPHKLNIETVRAFERLAESAPNAILAFVGEEADGGALRYEVAHRGMNDRVRLLGRQPLDAFLDLIAASDIGVNLRRPPTNGETSAALLDLLRHGVATIVTEVATFADFSSEVVRKVPWPDDETGENNLADALAELVHGTARRESLGRAALASVRDEHDWSRVAEMYAASIERAAASSRRGAVA